MKRTLFAIILTLLCVPVFFLPNTFAQEYTKINLPEGAKMRFGKGIINKIAYSPDGDRLAVASSIGVWMYDTKTGETIDLFAPNTEVESVSFSPDGQILATVNGLFYVRLWHATTGEHLRKIKCLTSLSDIPYLVSCDNVVFSPDGNIIAVGSDRNAVFLSDVNTGKQLHTLIESKYGNGTKPPISFSPDGKILASHIWTYVDQEPKRYLFLWDVNTGETLLQILTEDKKSFTVSSISFSPDGATLAIGSGDEIRFWDVNTGETLQTLTGHTNVSSISFSPDGATLATGSRNEIRFWNVNIGETLQTLTGHTNVSSISFSPDGATLATGSRNEIRFWDVNTGETLQTLTGHTNISSISFSPDGATLATGSRNGAVLLWDTNTGEKLQELTEEHSLHNVAFSPDGNTLAYLRGRNEVQLRNVNTDKLQNFTGTRWVLDPHTGVTTRFSPYVFSIAFSPDGNTLAIGGNWIISLLNTNTGKTIHNFTDIACRIESVAFSPDGNTIAGGGSDSIVRLWDITTHTERQIPTWQSGQHGDIKVVFSPDGNTLATVPDTGGRVLLWDVNTGNPLQEFTAEGSGLARYFSVAFSPDGNTLATGSRDVDRLEGFFGTVTLWNINTGETLQTLTGHTSRVSSISFSPDGATLATGGGGTVLLWKFRSDGSLPVEPEGKQLAKWGFIKSTKVFQNYPNPFNPETWIPYQLAKPANVALAIYSADGKIIRTLQLGNMPVGRYQTRSRAAYWNGKNNNGEPVASGLYFYTLTADDWTATRKMLILK